MKIVFRAKPQRTCCFLNENCVSGKTTENLFFFKENCVSGKTTKNLLFFQWNLCFRQNHKEPVVFLMKIMFRAKPQRTCFFFNEKLVLGKTTSVHFFSPLPNNISWYTILFFQALFPKRCLSKEFMLKRTFFSKKNSFAWKILHEPEEGLHGYFPPFRFSTKKKCYSTRSAHYYPWL